MYNSEPSMLSVVYFCYLIVNIVTEAFEIEVHCKISWIYI